ncbi:carbohydrate esterase family 5 protein [Xylariaceae sp. FL0662B]|nr:carbohydrate esterase family 5 protein [Xylariaceae sp. FL0662B]
MLSISDIWELKMLLSMLLLVFLCFTAVSTLPTSLSPRQAWTVGYSAHELSNYGCKPIIFIFAKATIEPGNLVSLGPSLRLRENLEKFGNTVGPLVSDGLKSVFGVQNVATQGVDYWGFIQTNFYPGGAPPWGIYDMQLLLSAAATCPDSKIVAAGYSQGAALTHRAVEGLGQEIREKIAGVVTFGDTQMQQDGGRIRNFDTNRTLIICNAGDVVCAGTLYVFPIHFDYVKWVPTAVAFLAAKLLDANRDHPWPNGSFVFPNITTTTPPAAAPASMVRLPRTGPGISDMRATARDGRGTRVADSVDSSAGY